MDSSIQSILVELKKKINEKIEKCDLNSRKPPFLATNFAQWRKKEFAKLSQRLQTEQFKIQQQTKLEFIELIDDNLLQDFTRQMKQPYYDIVFYENYGIPKDINIQQVQQEHSLFKDAQKLAESVAKWCIELEIASDLVERAEIYGYYECNKSEKEIFYEFKKQLQGFQHQNLKEYSIKFIQQSVKWGIQSLSQFVWSKSLSLSNISFSAMILLFYSLIGPQSIIASTASSFIPKISIQWIFGGLFGSYLLNKIAYCYDKKEISSKLQDLSNIFDNITKNIIQFNDKCDQNLKNCALCQNQNELQSCCKEFELSVKQIIEQAETFKLIKENQNNIDKIIETQTEDGWTILQTEDQFKKQQQIQQQLIEDLSFEFEENNNQDQQNQLLLKQNCDLSLEQMNNISYNK